MLLTVLMVSILAGMAWSCLRALGYVVFLNRNLTLASVPAIQKRTTKIKNFSAMTAQAYKDYFKWVVVWMPVFCVTMLNAVWLWTLLVSGDDISPLHIMISAVSIGGVFTMTFANKFIQLWAYGWDVQLSYAKDAIILETIGARMEQINAEIAKAIDGSVVLSMQEMQIMLDETLAINYVTEQILHRQAEQIKFLERLESMQR